MNNEVRLELALDPVGKCYLDPTRSLAPVLLNQDADGYEWAFLPSDAWCVPAPTLRVEAWLRTDRPSAEGLACAVSAWSVSRGFDAFSAYDAGGTSGLDVGGFLGTVFDGRFVYFVPQHDSTRRSGTVLRYDTHEPFKSPGAYVAYDASRTAGLDTRGYYGAAFDGRYIYFTPRMTEDSYHSRVLRYDTQSPFTDVRSWDAHDAGIVASFQGSAYDGRFVYFCPGYVNSRAPSPTGLVLRLDTHGGFHDALSWETYDASSTSGLHAANFDGGAFDGRYIYFIPLSQGAVLRCDTHAPFNDAASWTAYDVAPLGVTRCVGSVFDGRYLYLVPYGGTRVIVRYDTAGPFTDAGSWQAHDAGDVDGLKTVGYDGGVFDGRYVYFIPFWDEAGYFHGNMLRFDTFGEFTDAGAWSAVDASDVDGLRTIGYNAAAFDGRCFYCAPWHDGAKYVSEGRIVGHARILRYDTAGAEALFSLRYSDYGHNGGLCAAAPGPAFIINTDRGARGVAAHHRLEPGEHHLIGEYDGRTLSLYVDGRCAAQRAANGAIVKGKADLTIGRLARDAAGRLPGIVTRLRIGPCGQTRRSHAAVDVPVPAGHRPSKH